MDRAIAIQLKGISKYFGEVVANNDINLTLYKGEILSLLGENGSGKTTLMNMISGIYYPDKGHIEVGGKEVQIRSPKDAFDLKIGMIHQHFKLVDVFTGADNIILGEKAPLYSVRSESKKILDNAGSKKTFKTYLKIACLPFIKLGRLAKFNYLRKNRNVEIQKIADQFGFDIDVNKKIYDMSVSEKQTVEIIKVLYRGADILVLDEPTAVLTPQEIKKLFNVLSKMKEHGKSIIIITHKLNEVMAISDRVAVLRRGENVGEVSTTDTDEQKLTELMVGKKVELNIERSEPVGLEDRLVINKLNLNSHDGVAVLKDISFKVRSGEILGIAGIAGSGQRDLLETIAGLHKCKSGEVVYNDPSSNEAIDLKTKTASQIRDLGVRLSFVPEDRLGMGLVGNMDIVDNVMLRSYRKGKSLFLDRNKPKNLANEIIEELEVKTPGTSTAVRKLSGGNVQKILVGREISLAPTVLMAAYPVRGLDINSSYTIYNLLTKQKEQGVAVIFVGEDLDVLLELCDRIIVVCAGEITGEVDARTAKKEEIGLLMTKSAKIDFDKKEIK